MNLRALGRGLGLLLAVGILLGAGRVRAAGSSEDEKHARELYERAEKSFNVGKFAEALTDYQAAYEAKPLPGFLFNIAQCYRNLGNYERARFFFRRYLSIEPKAPNHRRVEQLIDEMSRQIDAQAAAATAAATTTTPPSTTTPPPASTPPAETRPAEAAATPEPAEPAKVPEPVPAAVEPAPSASATLVAQPPPPEEEHPPVYTRWWFWTGVAAVVAGGAVAAFFLTRPQTKTPGTLDPIDARMP